MRYEKTKPRTKRGFCLARKVGIEPTTIRLTVERSTAELLPNTVCTLLEKCNTNFLALQDQFLETLDCACAGGDFWVLDLLFTARGLFGACGF